jgi:hypothetical protein
MISENKKIEVINLGCANSWDAKNPPDKYLEHKKNCGQVDPRCDKYKTYNMSRVNIGRCYNKYYCNDCGIQYTVDSSD